MKFFLLAISSFLILKIYVRLRLKYLSKKTAPHILRMVSYEWMTVTDLHGFLKTIGFPLNISCLMAILETLEAERRIEIYDPSNNYKVLPFDITEESWLRPLAS